MRINRKMMIVFGLFLVAGLGAVFFLPKEGQWNSNATIKIGAGDDLSGLLMKETVQELGEKYEPKQTLESSSFQDCCSNTAQWAMNAKEINLGFYCTHIARRTIELNKDVEIYGPVIMNGETIIYKGSWEEVSSLGITQGREQYRAMAEGTYAQIKEVKDITQKGILYAIEDGQVDGAILDVTKAARVPTYQCMPLADTDYISYVLVVDKKLVRTNAFADFIESYNKAATRLGRNEYLAEALGLDKEWLAGKRVKFLQLEQTGVNKDVNFSTRDK